MKFVIDLSEEQTGGCYMCPLNNDCTSCGAVRRYFFWYDNTGECRLLIQRRCPACDRRIVEPNS